MELIFTSGTDCNIIKLIGELDTPASLKIQDEIDRISALKDKNLVVDCSELEYIASSGLRQLLALHKATLSNNLKLDITGVSSSVMSIFKVTNFDRIFNLK